LRVRRSRDDILLLRAVGIRKGKGEEMSWSEKRRRKATRSEEEKRERGLVETHEDCHSNQPSPSPV